MPDKKFLVCIVGPTAVGKTSVAIDVATHFKTEIISADSRQIFKELAIGTAKPTKEERALVKHHFVDSISINDEYSAGQFEKESIAFLNEYFKHQDVSVCAGGSGLYVNALLYGFDDLASDENIRAKWNQKFKAEGIEVLQDRLKQLDPEYYEVIDKQNSQRLIRAIEVCEASGDTYSAQRRNQNKKRSFEPILVGLTRDRRELYERINNRVDLMLQDGLLDEVKSVLDHKHMNSLNTVGYKELFAFFENECTLEEAVELIKRNTRRFSKRQMTWFKRYDMIDWFHPDDLESIITHVAQKMKA